MFLEIGGNLNEAFKQLSGSPVMNVSDQRSSFANCAYGKLHLIFKGCFAAERNNVTCLSSCRGLRVPGWFYILAGHFPAEVQTQLKIMAAEGRSTIKALLGEALDLLFAKRRKPQIARKSRERSQR